MKRRHLLLALCTVHFAFFVVPPASADGNRPHVFFIHGANVSEDGARAWGAEMFKRLWQSGADMDYGVIAWYSDKGMPWNYHENVSNAWVTAAAVAQQINSVPGRRIVIAHSLGTLVAASAIQDHGAQVEKLIMLNSAIPSEAFDPSFSNPTEGNQLVHDEWVDYTNACWSALWHELFPTNDARSRLTWKGRFAEIFSVAENFYSSGDEVLEYYEPEHNPPWYGGFNPNDGWGNRYSWQKQELYKGRASLLGFAGTTDWAGWGFHLFQTWQESPSGNTGGYVYTPMPSTNANAMTDAELQDTPVFRHSPSSMFSSTISSNTVSEILACGIPALSGPAGSRELPSNHIPVENVDLNSLTGNDWPESSSFFHSRWLHSDVKNIALPFVKQLFETVSTE